jgi:small subunit ribosomal protein S16
MNPSTVEIDNDRVLGWLAKGARPTETVRKLLVISGAWEQFESTRPPKQASHRYARPGRATAPGKKAPGKQAPAKKAAAAKAPAGKAPATAIPAEDAGDAEAES